jgi:DNA-directed RNA polymerase specialized sigma24 family protein
MKRKANLPGEWPDPNEWGYDRLVNLARRRLVGHEYLAEDVVSLALMKWSRLPPDKASVARIEQIIKSEAYSMLRSEQRRREREARVAHDRSSPGCFHRPGQYVTDPGDQALSLLRQTLVATCKREKILITAADIEVLELLFSGCSPSEVARITGLGRYKVRKSRLRWASVLAKIEAETN